MPCKWPATLPCRGKVARFPPAPRWDRAGGLPLFLLINRREGERIGGGKNFGEGEK